MTIYSKHQRTDDKSIKFNGIMSDCGDKCYFFEVFYKKMLEKFASFNNLP